MPDYTYVFDRIEKKYLLSARELSRFLPLVEPMLTPDEFGKSTVSSLYLDTPDLRIARECADAENYREKLRIRSYGTVTDDDTVFFEIKKKLNGITYKRRESMTLVQAEDFIFRGKKPFDSQIVRELEYALWRYGHPLPTILVRCEREAFYFRDYPHLRLTFDSRIRYRADDLDPRCADAGEKLLLPPDVTLVEFKTDGSAPREFSRIMSELTLYPRSFSKYCVACADVIK